MRLVISGSSLSIGDKVIVASGSSTRVDAFQHLPLVGRELNAPLLGHNPSQWPRNPGLLVTAMCLVHCNSIVTFCCNSKCTIVHFCLHLKDQSSTYTIKKSRRSLCSIFWCFPELSVYPHCVVCIHTVLCVSRGSKVVLRLVSLNSTVVSLSLGPTVVSPRPLLWEDNDDNDDDYDDHQVE